MHSDFTRKKPLYRKVNTRTHGVRHGSGSKARKERNTKRTKKDQSQNGSMHSKQRHGYDYTPLFKFLLTKVGCDWDIVFSEASARLDNKEPIFWMVALHECDKKSYIRVNESTYFSGLFVNDDNRLELVDSNLTVDDMKPTCACCTHTFNGERYTQEYESSK